MSTHESAVPGSGADRVGARGSFLGSMGISLIGTATLLLVSVATGVIAARELNPAGRGIFAGALVFVQLTSWITGSGIGTSVSYALAKGEHDRRQCLTTGLATSFGLGLLGSLVGYVLLLTALRGESAGVRDLSLEFVLSLPVLSLSDTASNAMNAVGAYRLNAVLRPLQGVLYLVFIVAGVVYGLTPFLAMLAYAASVFATTVISLVWLVRRVGLGRVRARIAREQTAYCLRVFPTVVTGLSNSHLDMLLLPSFVANADLGYYSVATTVSFVIYTVLSQMGPLLLPEAVRRKETGGVLLAQSMRMSVLVSAAGALVLGLVAGTLVRVAYGANYAAAVPPLRILLPGIVCLAMLQVVFTGLMARNRPGLTSVASTAGLLVTLPGLALFLPHFGITAAATVSTVAYAASLGCGLWLLRRVDPAVLSGVFSPGAYLRDVYVMRGRVGAVAATYLRRRPATR